MCAITHRCRLYNFNLIIILACRKTRTKNLLVLSISYSPRANGQALILTRIFGSVCFHAPSPVGTELCADVITFCVQTPSMHAYFALQFVSTLVGRNLLWYFYPQTYILSKTCKIWVLDWLIITNKSYLQKGHQIITLKYKQIRWHL